MRRIHITGRKDIMGNIKIIAEGAGGIIKDSVIEQFTSNQLDLGSSLLSMLAALVAGIIIFIVYKMTFRGVVYSATFNMSLVLMTLLTAAIVVTISSNVVLSLGMVGALSIVRFRSAVKDPVDIMYLFWAITVGIIIGAGQYLFAAIVTAVVAAVCFLMRMFKGNNQTYLLVVRCDPQAAGHVSNMIGSLDAKIRNKTATARFIETTAEIPANKIPKNMVEKLQSVNGVMSAVLVNYNGEYCD